MTRCSTCRAAHDRKGQRLCRTCHAAYMRSHRPKYSELTPLQRLKANARAYANSYQRRGHLVAQACEKCGALHAEKHHEDYEKPLEVRWLCRGCHIEEHHTTGDMLTRDIPF